RFNATGYGKAILPGQLFKADLNSDNMTSLITDGMKNGAVVKVKNNTIFLALPDRMDQAGDGINQANSQIQDGVKALNLGSASNALIAFEKALSLYSKERALASSEAYKRNVRMTYLLTKTAGAALLR